MIGELPSQGLLRAGEWLRSDPPGPNELHMWPNGNAVLIRTADGHQVWGAGASKPGTELWMQDDGNLLLRAPDGSTPWASDTSGQYGARLWLQPDGNLVIVSTAGSPIWTAGPATGPSEPNALNPGDALLASDRIVSPDGHTVFQMQEDGNASLLRRGVVRWAINLDGTDIPSSKWIDGHPPISGTIDHTEYPILAKGGALTLQQGGKLLAYPPGFSAGHREAAYWVSKHEPVARVEVTDDGLLLLFDDGLSVIGAYPGLIRASTHRQPVTVGGAPPARAAPTFSIEDVHESFAPDVVEMTLVGSGLKPSERVSTSVGLVGIFATPGGPKLCAGLTHGSTEHDGLADDSGGIRLGITQAMSCQTGCQIQIYVQTASGYVGVVEGPVCGGG
jgi:hypothetical protein